MKEEQKTTAEEIVVAEDKVENKEGEIENYRGYRNRSRRERYNNRRGRGRFVAPAEHQREYHERPEKGTRYEAKIVDPAILIGICARVGKDRTN